jgi:hypothetical protein
MSKSFTAQEWEKIELYMKAGATQKRIAESFHVDVDTLRAKFKDRYGEDYSAVSESFRRTGELLIEATQFQKAISGNISMLIWLGKVRCGQRESEIISTTSPLQTDIDKDHIIMQLNHKIKMMSNLIQEKNANKR